VGRLTGPDSGPGRLPDPDDIVEVLYAVAAGQGLGALGGEEDAPWGDLHGLSVLITAGGTREPIDPVRFLGNHSSGHQGFALAEAARERGASVTVVAANVALPLGEGIARIDVETSQELGVEVKAAAQIADVVIMAAAVADFRPETVADHKIKKQGDGGLVLRLVQTEDVLSSLVASRRQGQVVIGFAAETGDGAADVLEHGQRKARRKGADLLVVNPVGEGVGFGDVSNSVTMLDARGEQVGTASGSKLTVAHAILDKVRALARE
jgi:phosphopantothenoylcysteine decarboxylase/phosphopantothenate--cysteine ligase